MTWIKTIPPDQASPELRKALEAQHELYPKEYERAKALWLGHVATRGTSARVLANASRFLLMEDRARAQDLLERAIQVEPENPEWRGQLGHLHALEDSDREPNPEAARAALKHFEAATARAEGDSDRYLRLGDMADAARRSGEPEQK